MDRQLSELAPKTLSLMTYSHDGYGLGHLRRNTNIAAQFIQQAPGSSALMLTGCPSGNPFPLPKGIDFIKVPSLVKVDTGVYAPASLRISRQKAKAIRASVILGAVMEFKPNVLLVDHVAAGTYGELLPTLRMLKRLGEPPAIVLGLRDIIDAPDVVCDVWQKEMTYQTIREYYDEVVIYGCKEIFDAAHDYDIIAEFPGSVRYSGYVCSQGPVKSREQVRADLRLRRQNLVVVTTGGGHDGYPLMRSCLEAFHLIGKDSRFEAVLITGPLMDPDQREQLRSQARGLGARVFGCVEDAPSFINAADLVITMAGYNSLCEVVSLRRKALVVPRLGPRAEQRMRAKLFQEKGLIDVLEPQEVSPKYLAQRIIEDLERTDFPQAHAAIDTTGTSNAACRLSELALERAALLPTTHSTSHAVGTLRAKSAAARWADE
jgi:predicted glycosyltransferase